MATRYKQYCELIKTGMTQIAIAKQLGLDRSYIGNLVARFRDMGWDVPKPYRPNRIMVHGGGSGGIKGCKCELCVARRKQYKLEWRLERELKLSQGIIPATSRTSHGEGSRGIKYCKCDLCKERRRDYKKEWTADVKAHGFRRQRNASVAQG